MSDQTAGDQGPRIVALACALERTEAERDRYRDATTEGAT